jgi:hypothetical protein
VFAALIDQSFAGLLCTAAGMLLIGAIAGMLLPQETAGAQLAESIEAEAIRLARGPAAPIISTEPDTSDWHSPVHVEGSPSEATLKEKPHPRGLQSQLV